MKYGIILFTVLAGCLAAQADSFSLRHEGTGKVFGPFDSEAGSRVTLGKATFIVVRPDGAESSPLMEKLRAVTIPSFNVRAASPMDCLALMQDMVRTKAPTAGVNIVPRNLNKDPFSPTAKRVTLDLRDVSAHQALVEICEQAELTMKEQNGMVLIEPRDK